MIEVPLLDADSMAAARARLHQLATNAEALGRLEELAVWAAGAQGRCPPQRFAQPVLVLVAADHGVAAAGFSRQPAGATARRLAALTAGGGAGGTLAGIHGVQVQVIDVGADVGLTGAPQPYLVRQPGGRIDIEDALTADEAHRAFAIGRLVVDQQVDAGADLLILGDLGRGSSAAVAVIAAALTGTEPLGVVPRSGVDDQTWMRRLAVVRDALRRANSSPLDVLPLLAAVGGADLAAACGLLVQAAVRRTPVLLDGALPCVAGMLAETYAPACCAWWLAGTRSPEPAQALALKMLGIVPLIDLAISHGEGTGALIALPVLQSAVALLAELPTRTELYGPPGEDEPA